MEPIVRRLNENRQVELAKSILESNGYKVSKKRIKESVSTPSDIECSSVQTSQECLNIYKNILENPGDYSMEGAEEFIQELCSLIESHPGAVVYEDLFPVDYEFSTEIFNDGYWYIKEGILIVEEDGSYPGYFYGNVDAYMSFIYTPVKESRRVRGKRLKESTSNKVVFRRIQNAMGNTFYAPLGDGNKRHIIVVSQNWRTNEWKVWIDLEDKGSMDERRTYFDERFATKEEAIEFAKTKMVTPTNIKESRKKTMKKSNTTDYYNMQSSYKHKKVFHDITKESGNYRDFIDDLEASNTPYDVYNAKTRNEITVFYD